MYPARSNFLFISASNPFSLCGVCAAKIAVERGKAYPSTIHAIVFNSIESAAQDVAKYKWLRL